MDNTNNIEKFNNSFLPEQYFLYLYDYFILLVDDNFNYQDIRNLIIKAQKFYIKKDSVKTHTPLYIFITKIYLLAIENNNKKDNVMKFIENSIESYFEYKNDIIKQLPE